MRAVDSNPETWWGAGAPPLQWIQIDLGSPATIAAIRLTISQSPAGETVHRLLIKGPSTGGKYTLLYNFKGNTADFDVLSYAPPTPLQEIQFIRIETVSSPSWVAWREIEVIAAK